LFEYLRFVFFSIVSWRSLYLFACASILCLVWVIVQFATGKKTWEKSKSIKYIIGLFVFLLYISNVFRITGLTGIVWWLGTPLIRLDRIGLIPFAVSGSIVPELLNIIMTIPLGFILPLIWTEFRSLKKVAIAGFVFSLTIETMQLFTFRFSTTGDLITNTLGAVIGYGIFVACYRLLGKRMKEIGWKGYYEPFIYIFLALIGIVFLYHPSIAMRLPSTVNYISSYEFSIGREIPEGMEYVAVIVMDINGNEITGEILHRLPTENHKDNMITFIVTELTIITISASQGANHTFTPGSLDDILINDLLDTFIYKIEYDFIASEIIITRW